MCAKRCANGEDTEPRIEMRSRNEGVMGVASCRELGREEAGDAETEGGNDVREDTAVVEEGRYSSWGSCSAGAGVMGLSG